MTTRGWRRGSSAANCGAARRQRTAARLVGSELLTQTVGFWRRWLSKCRYHGRWREMVTRSVLVLKMLLPISPSHKQAAMALTLKINGTPNEVDVDGDTLVLRDVLGMTGTKFGLFAGALEGRTLKRKHCLFDDVLVHRYLLEGTRSF